MTKRDTLGNTETRKVTPNVKTEAREHWRTKALTLKD